MAIVSACLKTKNVTNKSYQVIFAKSFKIDIFLNKILKMGLPSAVISNRVVGIS
jgi:hypothetical protein